MKPQTVPHYGVRNGLVREGRIVANTAPKNQRTYEAQWFDRRTFHSINAAKRFMRIGGA